MTVRSKKVFIVLLYHQCFPCIYVYRIWNSLNLLCLIQACTSIATSVYIYDASPDGVGGCVLKANRIYICPDEGENTAISVDMKLGN